jgi:diguanylate cyclase (GGDEF)-like protein
MSLDSSRAPNRNRSSRQRAELVSTSATRIVQIALRENVSLSELAQLAATDPAFALRVLAFVNSPAMGMRRKVDDVQQATNLLGVRGMRTLGLSLVVTNLSQPGEGSEQLLANCLRRAIVAREIAVLLKDKDADLYFTAGLLLDSGLLASAKRDLERAVYIAGAPATYRVVHERACGFVPHPQLGAEIASNYGLGPELVEAIAKHHAQQMPNEQFAQVAWAAERCAAVFEGGDTDSHRKVASAALVSLALTEAQLDGLIARVPGMVTELASALDRNVGDQLDLETLHERAHQQLVALNEHYEGIVRTLEELLERKDALEGDLRAANERLERLASTDELTGLANRRATEEGLRRDLSRSDRDATPLSVVLIDVDHFKSVNDTWGHATGDAVLSCVGKVLKTSLRTGDVPGRWGGEEFLCILPNTDASGAAVVAERLRANLPLNTVAGPRGPVQVTASFGVASVRGPGCRNASESLMRRADSALYSAKEQGRDRVVVSA